MTTDLKRDPRIDPKSGDVLKLSGWVRLVSCAHAGRVSYGTRCGHQWLNSTQKQSIEDWRAWAKDAQVIYATG